MVEIEPLVPPAPICSVPDLIVVAPVYVLLLLRIRVLLPALVMPPLLKTLLNCTKLLPVVSVRVAPPRSVAPEKVRLPVVVATLPKVTSPPKVTAFVMVLAVAVEDRIVPLFRVRVPAPNTELAAI